MDSRVRSTQVLGEAIARAATPPPTWLQAGAVNLAAPEPLPNADFMRALRRAWGARVGLPATDRMIEVGAFLMRTETELVLKSRRVVPRRLPFSAK